ncbi:two pore potassium channel protein sup-9-like [Mytilus galloprovincialis]|uniref:Potassium channel domain-containing protein n=2 Tax=Mytilus galloprovincialis TaxID=29158 RepID=A0A8B6E8W4_MYTGA|nr:Hypothetical predicted protein [Mytilus galloprovincialis]
MEMKRQNVRTLSLVVCTFTYLLIGAAVFDALESEYEVENRRKLKNETQAIIDKFNITPEHFEKIRYNVIKSRPYQAGTQWKFPGALYFSLVVVALIGYGHSTPKTVWGKLFCMTYALVGIPLCMIMFQNVGERLNTFVTYLLKQIKKCFRMKNTEVSQTDLIFITTNLSTVIITAGALMFSHFEGWRYINSLYYCFITLTTIGFGDYVALQKNNMLQEKPHYVALSVIFILFGLAVISASMNLLVLRFLTLNAEDERRDELQAAAAAQNAVHLEGDVITGNSTVVGNAQEQPEFQEVVSVCSCSCYKWRSPRDKIYNSTVNSNHVSSFVPNSSFAKEDTNSETDSFLVWQRSKRASL